MSAWLLLLYILPKLARTKQQKIPSIHYHQLNLSIVSKNVFFLLFSSCLLIFFSSLLLLFLSYYYSYYHFSFFFCSVVQLHSMLSLFSDHMRKWRCTLIAILMAFRSNVLTFELPVRLTRSLLLHPTSLWKQKKKKENLFCFFKGVTWIGVVQRSSKQLLLGMRLAQRKKTFKVTAQHVLHCTTINPTIVQCNMPVN